MARAKRLDALFAGLKSTKVEEEADTMVADIWQLWLQWVMPRWTRRCSTRSCSWVARRRWPCPSSTACGPPDWAEGWNKRATVLYLIGEYKRSLAGCDRVLALEPRHFGALAGIGLIRIQKGEPREALAAFRKGVGRQPVPQGALQPDPRAGAPRW